MNKKDPNALYSVAEVADLLKLHPETIRRYIQRGTIKAIRLSKRQIWIPQSEIDRIFSTEEKLDETE